jgi:hypothetical protein
MEDRPLAPFAPLSVVARVDALRFLFVSVSFAAAAASSWLVHLARSTPSGFFAEGHTPTPISHRLVVFIFTF